MGMAGHKSLTKNIESNFKHTGGFIRSYVEVQRVLY
jgi:hypothetical protein